MLDLFEPIQKELEHVENAAINNLVSDAALVTSIGSYIAKNGGKRLRPALVLLTSRAFGYTGEKSINLACAVEFIHIATLLHDDVIDGADMRRGSPSANCRWGNEASILVGDYLFSKSFSIMVNEHDNRIMASLANASMKMAEGEVQQLMSKYDINLSNESYIDIVTKKTAELIASCCEVGAIIGGASEEQIKAMHSYGKNIGIAFQLIDDTLDFIADRKKLGKPICNDMREGKITMPLLHVLEAEKNGARGKIEDILRKHELDQDEVGFIMGLVSKHDSIEHTIATAGKYAAMGRENLKSLPDSPEKNALSNLSQFIVNRDN